MANGPWRKEEERVPISNGPVLRTGGPLRLRDWLVAQIESGLYAGLRWEDPDKTLFRIPWKHAAKQGYQAQQDAALFRAWAVYKGKHLEGTDKEDPSTWKTRLRCALNKSIDFREVRERSQLDTSHPYKVYRLVSDHTSRPGYQAQDLGHPWSPVPCEDFNSPDYWLHVRLFYGPALVREATARTAEGCHLSPGTAASAAAQRLLGPPARLAQVHFPEPPPGARVLRRLLPHLERGVLLWVAPEGVFAKRLCQGRVYWRGQLAPHRAQPNKLEREHTCQLLDTRRFLEELHAHLQDGRPEPEYQIRLCFGEEYPGPPDQPEERLVMAHVEPFFARDLLLHARRLRPGTPRGPQQGIPGWPLTVNPSRDASPSPTH
ncbi:interferon regulatory factor 4-like isoform X2 [Marmota flaviventris]|uniref:interferon regulatory factor 4-like isoform X2 n=1 Tax=Marmota flaviventris TaxID=93162 RepID=UPI003A8BD3C6